MQDQLRDSGQVFFLFGGLLLFLPLLQVSGVHYGVLPLSNGDSIEPLNTITTAVALSLTLLLFREITSRRLGKQVYKGRLKGSKTRRRKRSPVTVIFDEYGPIFFRRAFRMDEESFWRLLDLLEPQMCPKKTKEEAPQMEQSATVLNLLWLFATLLVATLWTFVV